MYTHIPLSQRLFVINARINIDLKIHIHYNSYYDPIRLVGDIVATIQKRGDTYKISVNFGSDSTGKQIRKHKTWKPNKDYTPKQLEKEIARQAVLFEEEVKNGLFMDSNIKFADFADKWVKEYSAKHHKATNIETNRITLIRVNQAIGHIPLSKLKPHHLNEFYSNLAEPGINKRTGTGLSSTDRKSVV